MRAFAGQYGNVMLDAAKCKVWLLGAVVCTGFVAGIARLSRPLPAAAFADKKAAGAELYSTRGCAHCHGENGEGTDKAPSLREVRKKLNADHIRDQIVHGGQGMPAFGDSLKDDEVEDLVSFLRAKKWITPPAVVHPVEESKPLTP